VSTIHYMRSLYCDEWNNMLVRAAYLPVCAAETAPGLRAWAPRREDILQACPCVSCTCEQFIRAVHVLSVSRFWSLSLCSCSSSKRSRPSLLAFDPIGPPLSPNI